MTVGRSTMDGAWPKKVRRPRQTGLVQGWVEPMRLSGGFIEHQLEKGAVAKSGEVLGHLRALGK